MENGVYHFAHSSTSATRRFLLLLNKIQFWVFSNCTFLDMSNIMALNLGAWCVILDSSDADELSAFYEKLLGWKRYKGEEWTLLVNEGQKGPWITFQ